VAFCPVIKNWAWREKVDARSITKMLSFCKMLFFIVIIFGHGSERLAVNYGWLASAGKYNTGRSCLVREKRCKMLAEKKNKMQELV
jgi:hypothetical protein